jgi:exodeoxyribonuclease-5
MWTDKQKEALKAVDRWYHEYVTSRKPSKQVFYCAGYAGTGKSTLARHFAENVGTCAFGAYTGKAALVMRKNGCSGARTIHSMIYIAEENKKTGEVTWRLNRQSFLNDVDLVIIDECFVSGTKICTPNGPKDIKEFVPGDKILNAYGIDEIVGTYKKEVNELVEVKIGKTTIACSRNHRFFTKQGLTRADLLKPGDSIIRTTSAMRLLQEAILTKKIQPSKVLLSEVQRDLVDAISKSQGKNTHQRSSKEKRQKKKRVFEWRFGGSSETNRNAKKPKTNFNAWGERKTKKHKNEEGIFQKKKWKRVAAFKTTTICLRPSRKRLEIGTSCRHRDSRKWFTYSLENRHSKFRTKNSDRNRWSESYISRSKRNRSKKEFISDWARVDFISILKSGNRRLDKYRDNEGRIFVYDLQAKSHHSFSVKGNLVHNCSMVDESLAKDLLSFRKPILVLGDPGQLPPVNGAGFFTNKTPDIMLTEIHRQAKDNPIIHLATTIRNGKLPDFGQYGESIVTSKMTTSDLMSADQVLVGRNVTRENFNNKIRKLKGFDLDAPVISDRLICLQNDKDAGILNGEMFEIEEILKPKNFDKSHFFTFRLRSQDNDERESFLTKVHKSFFLDEIPTPHWKILKGTQSFNYAYAITVHKSQGSQWSNVFILGSECYCFGEDRWKWLYTAVTRSSSKIALVLN